MIRREKDGVRLLGHGEITGKLTITAHSASASAKKALEDAGGALTLTRKEPAEAEA